MIDSLPLCVSVTCTVRWAFLYHKSIFVSFSSFVQRSQARSARAVCNAFRPVCHTVVALYYESGLANLEVLHVSMLWIISFDCSLNGLNTRDFDAGLLLDLDASRTDESTFGLLPCGCELALGRSNGAILGPEVNFTATSFLVRSTATGFSVLAGRSGRRMLSR